MPVLATFAAAVILMAGQTVYKPPGSQPPYDGGDAYLLGDTGEKLIAAFVRPEALAPGGYKAVTIATYDRTGTPMAGGRIKNHEYLGLVVNCQARTATITGLALWDSNGLGIEVYGGTSEVHAIQPNTLPAMAEELLCQGKGRKLSGYVLDAVQRWRTTGKAL